MAFEGPIGSPHRHAWIYIPHGSPHYNNPFYAEVITGWVENITYGVLCQVHIPKPYRQAALIVI